MSAPIIRVLLTEDVAADAELELRELKRAGLRVEHRMVDNEQAYVSALRDFAPEVILSDFSMPGFDGMAALAIARETAPQVPFIFVSGTIGEEYAIRALKSGATDYVLKTNLVRLPAAVERALAEAADRRRIERLSRIREFSSAINLTLFRLRELTGLLDEICRIAVEVGRFDAAHIGLIQQSSATLNWIAEHGGSEYLRKQFAEAFDSGRQHVWIAKKGVAAAFPLVVEGKAIGVLGLHAAEAALFDADEVRMLEELSANVSVALELIAKEDRIAYLALYDPLTGLPNRRLFHERLAQAIETARSQGVGLALVLLDLERFKAINDTLGRHTGDRLLQAVAQRLTKAAGDLHRVARLGGDLYGAIFPAIRGAEDVARTLEQGEARFFGRSFQVDDRDVPLSARSGIAVYPEDGADADALLRNAEAALKRAKETGERYLFYAPEINARVAEQVELEHRLRKAVENGELFLHYQPKLDLATRKIIGLEALMRWTNPEGGLVSPAKFVPVLEQTGLILEAGRQAIATASATYRRWQAQGLNPPRIAVNVSAVQLLRRTFVAEVRAALGDPGDDAGGVDLEITESLLMAEVDASIRKLRELREMGMHIALDDFGTGFSSLAYLSKLPLDTLKIDRGFVRGMTENADDTSIVSTIILLAQALKLKVVAEGVETEQQAQLLRLLRCDEAQGYLFSPPVAIERIEALLSAP